MEHKPRTMEHKKQTTDHGTQNIRTGPSRRGFTLIELLVVISIIGLLSSVVLTSLNSTRQKARDSVRKSDLKQLQLAMNLYLANHNDAMPTEAKCEDTSRGATVSSGPSSCTTLVDIGNWATDSDLRPLVTDGLLVSLPKDPINNSTYYYAVELNNSNKTYCIGARLENPSSPTTRFYVRGGEGPYQNPLVGSDTTCI